MNPTRFSEIVGICFARMTGGRRMMVERAQIIEYTADDNYRPVLVWPPPCTTSALGQAVTSTLPSHSLPS